MTDQAMDLWPWFAARAPPHDDRDSAGKEAVVMRADVNDELVIRGRHVGDEDRKGVIVEIHGDQGGPPYLVRWEDGHQSVFFPSSDTLAEHHPAQKPAST
jgi:hypothetical protein